MPPAPSSGIALRSILRSSFNVDGRRWHIACYPSKNLEGRAADTVGYCDSSNYRVLIAANVGTGIDFWDTLLHELIHAAATGLELDEGEVGVIGSRLAYILVQLGILPSEPGRVRAILGSRFRG